MGLRYFSLYVHCIVYCDISVIKWRVAYKVESGVVVGERMSE